MALRSGRNPLARFWGLSVRRQFLIGTSTMFACLLTLLVSAYNTASISRDAAAQVQHTQKIIDLANQAVNAMVDMETGYRGFLLTGQIDFLEPYEAGRESFTRQMSALEQDRSADPSQVQRWATVRQLTYQWEWQVMMPGIEQRLQMSMGNGTLDDVIRGQTAAKQRLDQIRGLVSDAISFERDQLLEQTEAADAANAQLQAVLVWGSLLSLLLGLLVSTLLARGVRRDLLRLVRANERVMQGDLGYRIATSQTDEFGLVAAAFDRMADELQASQDRREGLLSAVRRFAVEDNAEMVLTLLVDAAVEVTRADGAAVYRTDSLRGGLARVRTAGSHGLEPEFLPAGIGVVARAVQERQAQVENRYESSAIAIPELIRAGITACAVTPLIFEGQVLGALVAWTDKNSWGFSEIDASSLEILGTVSAATLARREHTAKLRQLADTDALTGLNNRRKGFERLQMLLNDAVAHGNRMSLALIDLDHFKSINDMHGHDVGDQVLRRVGALMNDALGPNDVAARWGGEEFVLGLYGASTDEAVDRLSALLDKLNPATANSEISIGFSGGVAECLSREADLPALLRCADAALYRAKQAGRGRLVVATPPRPDALAA